ncbi:MAG: hypothetical protein ACLUNO_08120 [Oscillospiraceae bacterium]
MPDATALPCWRARRPSTPWRAPYPREDGEVSIASYMNFLIVNGGRHRCRSTATRTTRLAVQQVQADVPGPP